MQSDMNVAPVNPGWSPTSWQDKPVAQPILYEDQEHLSAVTTRLSQMPDLVPSHEIDQLSKILTFAARGQAFVIQGGDCAEAFRDVQHDIVGLKQRLLADQSQRLAVGLGVPVVAVGRIAGQYSKPRSSCYETLSCGSVVNAYRGDNINGPGKTERTPDPERLCIGYHLAAVSLSVLRAARRNESHIGGLLSPSSSLYTSHEALHLPLETAMTRNRYNTSAHMLWLGARTGSLNGAHIEYLRGIRNPIGVKLGPASSPSELAGLLEVLNPQKTAGKIVLITRLGAKNVEDKLPSLIQAVQDAGQVPVWLCDPCHGNTIVTASMVKTRVVDEMLAELRATHLLHLEHGSKLGGIHLEQCGENDVTECVDCDHAELDKQTFPEYRTLCDPRLSGNQAREFVQSYVDFARGLGSKKPSSAWDFQAQNMLQMANDETSILARAVLTQGSTLKIEG